MPRSEEGEFILELGHRQLLSVFFIVVILLGVSFTMGYIVGRNSAPVAAAVPASGQVTTAVSQQPAANEPPLSPGQVQVNQIEPLAQPTGTMPAQAPVQATEPPAAAPVTTRPLPAAPAAAAPAKVPAPETNDRKTVQSNGQALPGHTYLQVMAVKKADAELTAGILRKKGFTVIVVPVPGDALYRVLVGPLKDAAALAKTKMDLEAANFKSMARKY
ncbi:MAG: SPOR domain-containing protein [Acidobacteriales bacterium]|nr:SPOR domain-containing protein [Terriglobales bacterium]